MDLPERSLCSEGVTASGSSPPPPSQHGVAGRLSRTTQLLLPQRLSLRGSLGGSGVDAPAGVPRRARRTGPNPTTHLPRRLGGPRRRRGAAAGENKLETLRLPSVRRPHSSSSVAGVGPREALGWRTGEGVKGGREGG